MKTWQERLGDLGIRKVVTKEVWQTIWQHVQPCLEDPTRPRGDLKLKRTKPGLKVAISAYGRYYTWDQAWKNMKSAGAVGQPCQGRSTCRLSGRAPCMSRSFVLNQDDPENPRPLPPDISIVHDQSPSRALAAPDTLWPKHPGAIVQLRGRESMSRSGDLVHTQHTFAGQQKAQIVQSSSSFALGVTLDVARLADRMLLMSLSTTPIISFTDSQGMVAAT